MKISVVIILCNFFIQHGFLFAQHDDDDRNGRSAVTGIILDRSSNSPIEYANIVIRSIKDSSIVTGTVSEKDGSFSIPLSSQGKYLVDIRFLGFKNKMMNIDITRETSSVNLGNVFIEPDPLQLKEVVVQGDRSLSLIRLIKKLSMSARCKQLSLELRQMYCKMFRR